MVIYIWINDVLINFQQAKRQNRNISKRENKTWKREIYGGKWYDFEKTPHNKEKGNTGLAKIGPRRRKAQKAKNGGEEEIDGWC